MNTDSLMIAARKHLGGEMESSARACFADAIKAQDSGNDQAARMWALKSLQYSVGVFSPIYRKAAQ